MLKEYYHLTKPGIIRGNLITAIGAFLFASKGNIDIVLLVSTLLGISCIIASACVFNNYIDRNIDQLMLRTKNRALARSSIKFSHALSFGLLLALVGVVTLIYFVNVLTVLLGVLAFFVYVILYGFTKRRSEYGTLVGSISGAMPITAGYTAVVGKIDETAVILFLILIFWQMPHFYAIAIYRIKDYKAAKLPMLPITRGILNTKIQIIAYILLFFIATTSLYVEGYVGVSYQILMTVVTSVWLGIALKGINLKDSKSNKSWAKKMFKFSLIVLLLLSVLLAFDNFLP